MEAEHASSTGKALLYAGLFITLCLCLWAGWRDFSPWIPQAEIRETIQLTVRFSAQLAVQFVVPAAITAFFAKEAVARLRARHRIPRSRA